MRILLDPAYVLHTRAYRDTSLIAYFFTKNHGLIAAVARSARGPRSRFKGTIMPFNPLVITASGKTELLQITALEMNGVAIFLEGDALFSGIYLNELLLKLLQYFDAYPNLFSLYQQTLTKLQLIDCQQSTLREFEKQLLTELGYGLQFNDATNGQEIDPEGFYFYRHNEGLLPSYNRGEHPLVFKGSHLRAVEQGNYQDPDTLRAARRLMRLAIGSVLGEKKLKSRELFGLFKAKD